MAGAHLAGGQRGTSARISSEGYVETSDKYFRGYLLWLTFPPMLLHLLGKPTALVITYGVMGALFMPFLAITLLFLLNGKDMGEWKNRTLLNVCLSAVTLVFVVLGINQLISQF